MYRTTRKIISFAVCVAILVVVLGALAWATSGFKNWDAKTWFNYWGKGDPTVTVPEYPEEPPTAPDADPSEDPELSDQSTAAVKMSLRAANSEAPGIHHDSDEATAEVTIPDVPKPEMHYVYDTIVFYVKSNDYTGLSMSIRFKYWNNRQNMYLDLLTKTVPIDVRNTSAGVVAPGNVQMPLVLFENFESTIDSDYHRYGDPTPDTWFIAYEVYTINSAGFKSETLSGDFYYLSDFTNKLLKDSTWNFEITDTTMTLPAFYSYEDMWNTVGTMPINEVLFFGYEVKVFPRFVDRRLGNDALLWSFTSSDELPTDHAYFAQYSESNISRYVEVMSDGITRDGLIGDYTIDLTKLSFANDLYPNGCTIVATPYVYSKNADFGLHISYVTTFFVEPTYFVIDKLDAPTNIQFDESGNLTWDAVDGANGYGVFVGDSSDIVDTPSYDMKKFPSGDYTVRIRALGNVGQAIASAELGTMSLTAYNASNNITQMVALTFDIDGDIITKLVPRGKTMQDYLYIVEADDREFGGWFYDNGYTTPVEKTDVIEKDITIYARLSDRQVTERPLSWWEKNMWYVLIPCFILAGVLFITVIAAVIQSKRNK